MTTVSTNTPERTLRKLNGLGEPTPQHDATQALPVLQLDQRTYDRALDCVHCGLCLPACPTYTETGLESDSPRGRIHLMKGLADGTLDPTESVKTHLDLCLDCRACETACPSGVVYHELIEETRARLEHSETDQTSNPLIKLLFFHVFPYPTRLKLAMLPAKLMQKVGLWNAVQSLSKSLLPASLQKMQQLLPEGGSLWTTPPSGRFGSTHPDGVTKKTVGFFGGCVGSIMQDPMNRQAIDLLRLAGCDVVIPDGQQCCGAIHHHGGKVDTAHGMAAANLDAFLPEQPTDTHPEVDYAVTPVAGCGAMLREYDHLLRDNPTHAPRGRSFAERVRDVTEVLDELGLPEPKHRVERSVTYHDACHLAHAQKVTAPPRKLLATVPGLTVVELPESDMCCGAAGTYNLAQPEMAGDLGARKVNHIASTGCSTCVTGNIGCSMHITAESRRAGHPVEVVHPVSVLHEAHFGRGSSE